MRREYEEFGIRATSVFPSGTFPQVPIDDPKMYTKPFTIQFTEALQPDTDILEYVCAENEKDLRHIAKQ